MGKSVRSCMVFIALVGMANFAVAQGIGPEFAPAPGVQTSSFFASLPSFFPGGFGNAISVGGIDVRPALRVGFQSIGLSFNLPALSQIDSPPAPLDLAMKDANVWVGGVRLDVDIWRDWFLFGSAEANARQNVTVFTYDEPTMFIGLPAVAPYEWTGTQLEWWNIDGGIGYRFCPGAAIVAGSRWDHLSLVPGDPRDRWGNPVNTDRPCPNCPGGGTISDRASSDIQAKTWIPYFGFQVDGRGFRASLLFSPFGSALVRVPLRFVRGTFIPTDPVFPRFTSAEYAFRLRKPAGFLEGNIDYQLIVRGTVGFGAWLKGTWLNMRGSGEMTQDFHQFDQRGVFPPLYESQNATGTYGRYIAAGGLSASVEF